jgi:Holliday junction DNA helicase RuvA
MIAFLEGILVEKQPTHVLLNVGGVGYEVTITLTTYEELPPTGQHTHLITYHHVRDDAEVLYGFSSVDERAFFERLIEISGIGPATAIGILSGLPLVSLRAAIVSEDVKRLSSIKGVGKKTAERIIVELKDRISMLATAEEKSAGAISAEDKVLSDAVLALVALGYKNAEAFSAVKRVIAASDRSLAVEEVVRLALTGMQPG